MFKGLSRRKFYKKFRCEDDCRLYLHDLKWKRGYVCKRCGNTSAWKGRTSFNLKCAKCAYDESVTANTVFHKLKFPLLTAFGLAFEISVPKKGRSSNDLWKEFGVNPKTVYAFRKKIQNAIESGYDDDIVESVDANLVVDGITLTKRGDNQSGFQRIAVQLKKLSKSSKKKLRVQPGYFPPEPGDIDLSKLIGGKFKEERARIVLWNFKTWLTGTHHHCSLERFGGYLHEFFFRYNFRHHTDEIWHRLIEKLMVPIATNHSVRGCKW